MPATREEMVEWVFALLDQRVMPDANPIWADGSRISADERRELLTLLQYEGRLRVQRHEAAQQNGPTRRSRRLLASFLSPEQRERFRLKGEFYVTAPSGRVYRFHPGWPPAEVERHGKRVFAVRSFCLHQDPEHAMPAADLTLAQLLLLSHSEEAFRAEANHRDHLDQLWNGDYLRRLRRAQQERQRLGATP